MINGCLINRYVAHEYEKSKEMAAAALAYKLAEVAYLKVVYSSHANASKDRQELQTTLTGPTGCYFDIFFLFIFMEQILINISLYL